MAPPGGENPPEGGYPDVREELTMIADLAQRLELASALNKLTDLLIRSRVAAIKSLRNQPVALLARWQDLENAWRTGQMTPANFELRRAAIADDTKRLVEMIRAGSGIASDGSNPAANMERAALATGDEDAVDEAAVVHALGIGLTRRTTNFTLASLSLKVMPGEIVGIIGVNGSGKSTLLDILRGEIAPDVGVVHYPQLSNDKNDWPSIRAQIGYVPQRSVPWRGDLRSNLEYACALHGHLGRANIDRTNMLLSRHGLSTFQRHLWSQLSGGYRLRADLAMARVQPPALLIFDEPLANLDPVSQQTFLADLSQLARGEGGFRPAVILTSQHLYEIEAVASRVIVLYGGREVPKATERSCAYFEIWAHNLTLDKVKKALAALQPSAENGQEWDVRMGQTSCIVALAKTATVASVADVAKQADITLTYIRDVTKSARIELDALVEGGPSQDSTSSVEATR